MDRRPPNLYRTLEVHPQAKEGRKPFALGDVAWLGFDLDHTLVRYKMDVFMPLCASAILQHLVTALDYPQKLVEADFDFSFAKKGLIIDKELGNVVKLDCQGRVLQGAHGSRWLSASELAAAYGADPLPGFEGRSSERYWPLNTFFDIPVAPVFAAMVDLETGKSYTQLTLDIYDSVSHNYLSFDGGYYFGAFKETPEKYVHKRDEIKAWLASLKASGSHKLFVATNSMPAYSKLLLDFAFGPGEWEPLFDLVLFKCCKPAFFTEAAPFQAVTFSPRSDAPPPADGSYVPVDVAFRDLAPGETIQIGGMYHYGNAADLHAALDVEPADIAYFGDHIPYDCGAAKIHAGWRTVGVVEEVDYDRSPHSDPQAYNSWSCFFTYDPVAEINTAVLPDPASSETYYKKWMDEACDAVVPDLNHLIGVELDTVLNTSSFFVNPAVPPLPPPGVTHLHLDGDVAETSEQ
ncbi:uncharacterized protein AMSG_06886 [Thecamonas trahens ATCC 50062]|uniref:5'-nucleotidase domain-containing protein 1 n=1 Tax=Thecamonas trahens ATCC 50062 TaxID=461836 RepID=A0A0L0DDU9_THETB|nr:hypothetical protein AMSG_06886 [Thecamonas trahens ATCC 50062]KNC50395.1 hypothetical protein AMSG_06886 [Thecamonas trahens ATCC 50062]|eukprot:XP_013756937.1 hypothetical protein AMSG_06886 [Thecamonas trahens ATCC 50062]